MLSSPFAFDYCSQDSSSLLFDDAPLESILYGAPGEPTSADLFGPARPILTAIGEAMAARGEEEALGQMRRIYDEGFAVPTASAVQFVAIIGHFIPACAWPILPPQPAFPFDTILHPLCERAMTDGHSALADAAGSLVARYYEGSQRFADARTVLTALLAAAQSVGDRLGEAQHANNLAYEFLLEGQWSRAEELCVIAAALFTKEGAMSRANNAQANGLTARFGRLGLPAAQALAAEIEEVLQCYASQSDPRRRKPLVLLARLAADQRDFGRAMALMAAAVEASEGIPTHHRAADEAELQQLRRRAARQRGDRGQ